MSTSLVQAVKDFRDSFTPSDPSVVLQSVLWDLDPTFIGEPLTVHTVGLLSSYVDRKLEEYAAIHGSSAAVRVPQATVCKDGPNDCTMDNHVDSDRNSDGFMRFNTSKLDTNDRVEEIVEALEGAVDQARKGGVPAGILHENGDVDYPCLEDGDQEKDEARPLSGYAAKRIPDTMTEGFVVRPWVNDQALTESSWMEGGDSDALVNSSGALPSSTHRSKDSFLREVPQDADARRMSNGVLRTQDLREVNNDPMRPIRVNASSGHARPSRFSPTKSYVTSYDINHRTFKISARVITVPASMKVGHEIWFDLQGDGPKDMKEVVRSTVRANLLIQIGKRNIPQRRMEEAELIAQETLREMVSEENFRRYLKYGFITVRGRSGDVYQIFRDRVHTDVWRAGKKVEEVCVDIHPDVHSPPTDKAIALMTMLVTDEVAFRKSANVYPMDKEAA